MILSDLLTKKRVSLLEQTSSKKRALELIAEMLSGAAPEVSAEQIFDALNDRERLGSTGLGHGVAIPHGRLEGVHSAIGAVLRLDQGIDYDAPDGMPVNLMFGLVVPQESTDEHLAILSRLAELFADDACVERLRRAGDADEFITMIRSEKPSFAA